MAVYKIFPSKTATIYSENNTQNTGISEILDLSKVYSLNYPSYSAVGRALVQFDTDDINYALSNYIGSASFSSSLRIFNANATSIPLTYDLKVHAISGSWDQGTGRIDNVPITTNGVCWQYMTANPISYWSSSSYAQGVTASFFLGNPGGGTWYTSSISQSFDNNSDLDINFDVTSIVNQFVSGAINNNGFIIKNDSSIEFNPNYQYGLYYFSKNTNTIYPPCLELKWDDSVYNPNTGSTMAGNAWGTVISIGNNKGNYSPESIVRFNVNARDQYPQRTFVTSSLYTMNQYLPSSSYYQISDVDTENIIVTFDNNFTKISTDQNGSYFNLYMNGFEPERYYKIEIMIKNSGIISVYDNDYYFKVSKQ